MVARAFTTSQSALAHQKLFQLIFDIAKDDTGETVQFRHIHGNGFDMITADGHQGQALGTLQKKLIGSAFIFTFRTWLISPRNLPGDHRKTVI